MSNSEAKLPDAEQLAENIAAQTAEETAVANVNAAALAWTLTQTLNDLEPKVEAFEVPSDKQYFALGYGCQLFQAAPPVLREICKRAGVKFSMAVNDVPYLTGDDLISINRYLQQVREQHEAKP